MDLRSELMPPVLDESLVARLTAYAEEIDCGHPEETLTQLAAFNKEAATDLEFADFQGIYGGQDHHTWVRKILGQPYEKRLENVSKSELVELARRVMQAEGSEHAIDFWLSMLEINIPNSRISALIFWPGEYFGHEDYPQELSPEQVIEIALRDSRSIV
jgi:hypothetical protein